MEIKRLNQNNYGQLIDLLNNTFSKSNNCRRDFRFELPKMQYSDNEHVSKHIGIFDNEKLVAAVGIYPFEVKVGESTITVATTGNVVTHYEYAGRGYMNTLMNEAVKEVRSQNIDIARLGGLRQRYRRFGFEPVGIVEQFTFTESDRKSNFPLWDKNVEFVYITKDNYNYLKYAKSLYDNNPVVIKRSDENDYLDMFYALNFWQCQGYMAVVDDIPLGYISVSADGTNINEIECNNTDAFCDVLCAWQKRTEKSINYKLSCWKNQEIAVSLKICEYAREFSPSHFNVFNYVKVINAFLKLKSSYTNFDDGEVVIDIKGYGKVRMFSKNNKVGAGFTDERADMFFDKSEAMQVLFGYGGRYYLPEKANPMIFQFCPLPLSWNKQDAT